MQVHMNVEVQNILHLNEHSHGHIKPRTVAHFQRFQTSFERFWQASRTTGHVSSLSNVAEHAEVKWPTD